MPVYVTGMVFAVSVTRKCTVRPSFSRFKLPASTMPPMRKALPRGASLASTWLGLKKNTRLLWKAFSTSAAAMPSAARPAAMIATRLCLGFIGCYLTVLRQLYGLAFGRNSRQLVRVMNATAHFTGFASIRRCEYCNTATRN